ncbi:cytochrome P450 family protein [Pleurotus pulmonarius]
MIQDFAFVAFVLFLTLASYFLAGCFQWSKVHLPLPPGPKGYPILGNLFDLHNKQRWVKFLGWSKEYNSEIIHLRVLGSSIIVLNSLKVANDLLSTRSILYSDRPALIMVNELLGWASLFSGMPYAHAWRSRRRAFWQEFNPNRTANHRPSQMRYCRNLLSRLLDKPSDFVHHIEYTLAASILSATYGIDVMPEHDPNIERARKALTSLSDAAISGLFLVDIFPFLRHVPSWMPGAGFKRFAEKSRPDTMDMLNAPFVEGCNRLRDGKSEPSLLSRLLRADGGHPLEDCPNEQLVRDVAAVAYTGGAETTKAALSNFIAAMLLYPEVQKKAQQEVDSFTRSALPSFEDLPNMPYVQATMLEVLRWQSVLPLGIAHRLTMDDEYEGYYMPKGSIVFVNVWALLRDEERYPNPDTFRPERFLKDGAIDSKLAEPMPGFGFGRRICPGRFFAMESLWLNIASILTVFDITKAKDEEGRDIEPDIKWTPNFTRHLIPFTCSITPRSSEREKLIRDSEPM